MTFDDLSPETKREVEQMALSLTRIMCLQVQAMVALIQAKAQSELAGGDEGEEWKR